MWKCPNCNADNWDSSVKCYYCDPEERARIKAATERWKAEREAQVRAEAKAKRVKKTHLKNVGDGRPLCGVRFAKHFASDLEFLTCRRFGPMALLRLLNAICEEAERTNRRNELSSNHS
jgi:hypothetical protein